MRTAVAVVLAFVSTSALTLAAIWWPEHHRLGWFELAGRPIAVDGEPVEDWTHANEVLARSVADIEPRLEQFRQAQQAPVEFLDRRIAIAYAPDAAPGRTERVLVQRWLPGHIALGGARHHPAAYARYEIVDGEEPAPR